MLVGSCVCENYSANVFFCFELKVCAYILASGLRSTLIASQRVEISVFRSFRFVLESCILFFFSVLGTSSGLVRLLC